MRIPRFLQIAFLLLLGAAQPASAACWQWSKTAANNATADPSINWREGQSPSSVNDSARAMMSRLAECRDDLSGSLLTTGGSTAYAVTTNQGLSAVPTDGQSIAVRLNVTNGVTATLVADGGTSYAIQSSPGVAIGSGVLIAGTPYRMTFNLASTAWVVQDFYNNSIPAGSVVTSMIADAAVTYAKMQNVSANRLLGNPTGSAAAPSEISLGSGLAFSGTSVVATVTPPLLPNYLSGLILSTAGSSATFGIAAGGANDSTNTTLMSLASAYTKTTSAWAVGSGNGALDTSTVAINTWYYAFLIERVDTGVVDVLFSLSPSSPTMPTNYTLFRRIGAMKTNGSAQWVAFFQFGDKFIFKDLVAFTGPFVNNVRSLQYMQGPTGIVHDVLFKASLRANGSGSNFTQFATPSQTDVTVAEANCDLESADTSFAAGAFERTTDATGQLAIRSGTGVTGGLLLNTYGWIDARGKN